MYCKILIIISIAKILILCLCLCCRYIGHHVKKMIERIGPENVMAVAFDGGADWQSTKELIQAEWPWICFLYCISHGVSLIIKDCFDEDSGIEKLIETNKWMYECQKWFSTHACTAFRKEQAEPGEKVSFVRPAATRYGRVLLQWKQFLEMKPLLRRVVDSGVYQEKNFADDEYADAITATDVWTAIERVVVMMGPLLLLIRLGDGQKPVISKLYGTMLYVRKFMEQRAEATEDGSVERQILEVFLRRWPNMQSDVISAAYMLDPLFVNTSKHDADCTNKLWSLARKIFRPEDDTAWTRLKGILVSQLAKFQSRGDDLEHMSSAAAWQGLTSKCALKWWTQWGVETPELTTLVKKIVPLIVGSGAAERNWKDVANVLTKDRNQLKSDTTIDLVFVRTWLRRELQPVSDVATECFKEWEVQLLRQVNESLTLRPFH